MKNKELIEILTDIIYSDESNEVFHIAIKKGIVFLDALKQGQKLPIYIVSNSVICECGNEMFKVIPHPYCCAKCGKRK